jgi:hypothetical protein
MLVYPTQGHGASVMSEEDSLLLPPFSVVAPVSSWLTARSTQRDSGSRAPRHLSTEKGSDPSKSGGVSTGEPWFMCQ